MHQVNGTSSDLSFNAELIVTETVFGTGDRDGDGLPDDWESSHGLDPNDPTGPNGAQGDPDADGASNAEEYAAGTDPSDAASVFRFLAVRLSSNGERLELDFVALAGRAYTLQAAPLGTENLWSDVSEVSAGDTSRTVTLEVPLIGQPTRMYRLVTPASL